MTLGQPCICSTKLPQCYDSILWGPAHRLRTALDDTSFCNKDSEQTKRMACFQRYLAFTNGCLPLEETALPDGTVKLSIVTDPNSDKLQLHTDVLLVRLGSVAVQLQLAERGYQDAAVHTCLVHALRAAHALRRFAVPSAPYAGCPGGCHCVPRPRAATARHTVGPQVSNGSTAVGDLLPHQLAALLLPALV